MPSPHFYRWVFTLMEQDGVVELNESFRERFKKLLAEHAKKWVFQKESAPSTGTLHYQGRLSLKTKMSKATIVQSIGNEFNIHWASEKDESLSNFYCTKEDSRVDGPWSNKDVASYVPRKIRDLELRGWQKNLAHDLEDYDDDRSIHFVLDTVGGIGKSTFCKYLACRCGAIVLPGTISTADNLMKLAATSVGHKKERITFLLDLPRSIKKDAWPEWLSALEQLKNGHIVDWRYQGINTWIEPPTIAVFTNSLPATELLTHDRWQIHKPNRYDDPIPEPDPLFCDEEVPSPVRAWEAEDRDVWAEFEADNGPE